MEFDHCEFVPREVVASEGIKNLGPPSPQLAWLTRNKSKNIPPILFESPHRSTSKFDVI